MSITTIAAEGEKQAVIIAAQGFAEVDKIRAEGVANATKIEAFKSLSNSNNSKVIITDGKTPLLGIPEGGK